MARHLQLPLDAEVVKLVLSAEKTKNSSKKRWADSGSFTVDPPDGCNVVRVPLINGNHLHFLFYITRICDMFGMVS